jgi:RNA polymerase sigma-70 factor (ECF subfamily)
MTAQQQLQKLRRHHIETGKRSVDREVRLPDRSSRLLARRLLAAGPSNEYQRREETERVRRALDALREADREILALRRIEGLSNEEAATLLEISPQAAKKRYFRAVTRLRKVLREDSSGEEP